MDLGLSGPEVRRLLADLTHVYHLAAISPGSQRADNAKLVNVQGTRSILELAMGADRLQRFSFFSTAFVSGTRRGVVLEEELDRGQSFRTLFEETKFEAERLVHRAARDMPISVFRPSLVVGDTRTGEIDNRADPYQAMLAFLKLPFNLPIPLPGGGDYPLNLVPVDYVCNAAMAISRDPRAVGRTFHLTDPNPLPARKVLDLIADHANRKRPKGNIPAPIARHILKLPGVSQLSPRVVDYFDQLVIYNTTNTLELLAGTDVYCPAFESYVGTLVAHLQRTGIP